MSPVSSAISRRGGVLEFLAGVLAAAGEFPPVVVGIVGVAGVNEQDFVVVVEEQDAGADPRGRFAGDGHPVGPHVVSSR
jgi:hypothetical protein